MASAAFIESIKCLSDSDKNRLICVLLHSSFTNSQIDWEAATSAFGANSKASMQRMYHAARQKHREQNGLHPLEAVSSTPKKSPGRQSAKTGGKRKFVNSDDDGDDEEVKPNRMNATTETPTKAASKRQKGRPAREVVKREFDNKESENDEATGIFC